MSLLDISRTSVFSDLGRRFLLSPSLSYIPSPSQLSQWLSTTVEGYCMGLTALVDSAATTIGFKGNQSQTIPGDYPSDRVHSLENNQQLVSCDRFRNSNYNDIESGGVVDNETKFNDQGLNQVDYSSAVSPCIRAPALDLNRPYLLAPEIIGMPCEKNSYPTCTSDSVTFYEQDSKSTPCATTSKVAVEVTAPTPAQASSNFPQDRVRKYAAMRTLKLPERQLRKAPTESELALRQIDEELAIEASQRDEYCARELAGRGIFVQLPTTTTRLDIAESPYAARRVRRETSVGPLNPSWGAMHVGNVPTIRILKPEEAQTPTGTNYRLGSGSSSDTATASSRRGRARSNAVYIPPRTSTTRRQTSERLNFKQADTTSVTPKAPVDSAKRLDKNRMSMSDWLNTIGSGTNSLVADHVAIKARSVLRASLVLSPSPTPPLSPTDSISSSDSSAPSTPVDAFFLPPSWVEEIETVRARKDRHRRARCSYLGNGCEATVSAVIPEELLTEEIGVAC
ncbi:unnamed protein product [Rhizoctonia solani]|uniref:Uncharacterized protein n=1 Tax=Rhizoctonia solani TaxID=456999 RepID=A0A8H3CJF0_9AGAM|nr:unnamed protein product [Rhizoctonia solani]